MKVTLIATGFDAVHKSALKPIAQPKLSVYGQPQTPSRNDNSQSQQPVYRPAVGSSDDLDIPPFLRFRQRG